MSMNMSTSVIIIGAGMAGLSCARRLSDAGMAPILVDKGRGIGGRMATRRVTVGETLLQFDHGAQYASVRDPGFRALLDRFSDACAPWNDGAATTHMVGVPGMSSLPRALAEGTDVRQGIEITGLTPTGDGWEVDAGADRFSAQRVVLTVPAPQARALIGEAHVLSAPLADIVMEPCLTLMASYAANTSTLFISRTCDASPLAWIAQDSSKPGRNGGTVCWVAQASAAWSAAHLEESAADITQRMVPLLNAAIGASTDDLRYASAHRWRYARVSKPLGQPFLRSANATLYIGGDWCLGTHVEAAWASGDAIANDILAVGDVG
jgi:renalase